MAADWNTSLTGGGYQHTLTDTFHVKGMAQLGKALAALGLKIEKNVMRGALRAGAVPIRDEARKNAAKATGALAKGLKVSTNVQRGTVYAKLRTSGKHGYIAHFIEFGTQRHWISSRKGKMLRIPQEGGGRVIVARADHLGSRAIPFMRPAIDTKSPDAVLAVANYMRNRLATQHGIDVPDTGDER